MSRTLVFEDDFRISGKFFEQLERYIRRLPVSWYRLMSGHIPNFPKYDFKHRMFYGKCLRSTGSLKLKEEDFAWVTLRLIRIVSMLEGGYDLAGLSSSVGVHVKALMHGTGEQAQPVDEDEY